jgi:hypothetical protein
MSATAGAGQHHDIGFLVVCVRLEQLDIVVLDLGAALGDVLVRLHGVDVLG